MKKSIIFLAALALGNTMYAKSLTQDQARAVAQKFLNSKGHNNIRLADSAILAYGEHTGQPELYIFTDANNEGFVIASADDELRLDLCFTTSSRGTSISFFGNTHSDLENGPSSSGYQLRKTGKTGHFSLLNAAGKIIFEGNMFASKRRSHKKTKLEYDAQGNMYLLSSGKTSVTLNF